MTDNITPQKKIELLKKLKEEKKKELEKLKKQQVEEEQELEDARKRLEESIEELHDETDYLSEEAEEERQRRKEEAEQVDSIDELASQTPQNEVGEHISYDILDRLKADNLYELTNYNTYNELKRLEEKPYLTNEEQEQVLAFQNQMGNIQDSYSQDQISNLDQLRGGYISRTENILKKIHNKMHDLNQASDYSQGEYRW